MSNPEKQVFITIPKDDYENLQHLMSEETAKLQEIVKSKTCIFFDRRGRYDYHRYEVYTDDRAIASLLEEMKALKEENRELNKNFELEKSAVRDLEKDIESIRSRGFWARVFNR